MGKLNYTNRKSEGVKLGEIVAKDLRKRITAFFSKSESRRETSSLELTLPGKNLTDDGFREIVTALEDILTPRDGTSCSKLEELNLSGNLLTTKSLRLLARIIRLASYDLKELNLAENCITATKNDELEDWEEFLESFRNCMVVRRIDLSGNKLCGPRVFEVLARVYSEHPSVDPTEPDAGPGLNFEQQDKSLEIPGRRRRALSVEVSERSSTDAGSHVSSSDLDLSQPRNFKKRRGLRAIPYLILNNCSMTDSGALHLSYILAHHYYPQQLVCQLKPGPISTQLDEYNQRTHCWGLVYLPNDSLTESGVKLLALAEDARKQLNNSFATPEDVSEAMNGSWLMVDPKQAAPNQRRRSSGANYSNRRASTVSTDFRRDSVPPDNKKSGSSDLESSRKKFQRGIIEGHETVDLWGTALRMLVYARAILLQSRTNPSASTNCGASLERPTTANFSAGLTSSDKPGLIPNNRNVSSTNIRPSGIDYTNIPGGHSSSVCVSLIEERDAKARLKITPANIVLYDRDVRNAKNVGNLSDEVWQRIIACAACAEGILSSEQRKRVIRWGEDRTDLGTEGELSGKGQSVQIWNVLEKMGCLTYEMKV
ncbi:hypothetical protein AOQ84DRAFT_21349 [Glonium stellatum]|uniref:Leucine rich repeat protein n=1 Tax=Glonium stellatum TaxID=574774 RepID=A0A8E2FCT1_9PEZI|nr:hypothetical protein AOQ84DRAFT_21349 [Glonium stellatum]